MRTDDCTFSRSGRADVGLPEAPYWTAPPSAAGETFPHGAEGDFPEGTLHCPRKVPHWHFVH
jgi:hypothetical protein